MATIIDGKAASKELLAEVKRDVAELAAQGQSVGLAVVLVGDDPASRIYVKHKRRACRRTGIESVLHEVPASTSQNHLLGLVADLNGDPAVHGILVQLPLPGQIDTDAVLRAVAPGKDVDGFHPENLGLLALGRPRFVPCTPAGILHLLDREGIELRGSRAVVVGRSNIVGKPVALLLLQRHATVTICHSRTRDLPARVAEADVVVAAVGREELVRGDWIRPGAAVIDVGINRNADGKLVGDVAFEEAVVRAGAITPVPGGVGPMTIASLLRNTVTAAESGLTADARSI